MIATGRGLLVLLLVTVLLGAWLARALTAARPEPENRAIAPGLDVEHVTELGWDRSPLPSVKVTPGQGGAWRWESADGWAAADASVVRDVLAALRAGRWHRRAEVSAAGAQRSQLTVKAGPTSRTIAIGQPLEGTEQQWIVAGEHALLVDRWIARALDPDPLALRVRHPVENAASSRSLEISHGEVRIRIDGGEKVMTSPARVLPRRELLDALYRAVEALEIARLSRPPADRDVTLTVFDTVALRLAPQCPDDPALAWLFSDAGNGCIARAQYDELVRAAAAFEAPPKDLAEPRLVPMDIEGVILVDGKRIDLTGKPLIGGKPTDAAAIAELLAALGAPAQVLGPQDARVQKQLIVVPKGGGEIAIELLGGGIVRRANEPVALQLSPAAYAALTKQTTDFADRSLWNEEPTTITELVIDGVSYKRGAVVGEWARTPAGARAVDGVQVEALVTALAQVHRWPDVMSLSKQHDVAIVVTPPAGAPVRHALAVGAPRQGGCAAFAGDATVILPGPVCAQITALAR